MKITLYPKTTRIKDPTYQVVEKLDGSNLGLFNLNGRLLIAQRNRAYFLSEIDDVEYSLYGGLYDYLVENGEDLLSRLYEGSGFFGEWIGMGQIKYKGALDKKLYMFVKANIKTLDGGGLEVYNIYWDRSLHKYPFVGQEIPECVGQPALISEEPTVDIESLDKLYDSYLEEVGRPVEGFIVMSQNGSITKYVRNKRGKIGPHEPPV